MRNCNKIGYETKKAALSDIKIIKADIKRYRKNGTRGDGKFTPYLCRFCSKWHLTTKQHNKKIKRSYPRLKEMANEKTT